MRVLVTGAGGGIGQATCRKLARDANAAGRPVAVAASDFHRAAGLDEIAEELRAMGAEVVTMTGDLAELDEPRRQVDTALHALGGLDAIVSNAGLTLPGRLVELAIADWDLMFDVNTRPTLLLAQAAYPALKESRGSIVATASMSGMQPHSGMGGYGPSKAALIMLVGVLAQELAADGIRVNAVSPGMVETPMTAAMYADPEIKRGREAVVPFGRVAQPEDIANAIAFLIGPDAGYCTGQNILVDGGFTASIMNHIPGRPRSAP